MPSSFDRDRGEPPRINNEGNDDADEAAGPFGGTPLLEHNTSRRSYLRRVETARLAHVRATPWARAAAGGETGPAVVAGRPQESLAWERVEADEMPPRKPLPEAEKAALRGWIAAGARWGTDPIDPFQVTTDRRAGRDWWSLRPIRRP